MDRLRRIFASHPDPASAAGDTALECVYHTSECALVCTSCADACLAEEGVADLRDCIRLNLLCAELCGAVARRIARPGSQDRASLDRALNACIRAALACAEECGQHAEHMEHCRICVESCRASVEACEAMRDALVA